MLESEVWKQVGDGTLVDIWEDRWIDGLMKGKVMSPKPTECQMHKVSDLIMGNQWNKDIIKALFSKEEAEAIMQIPLSVFQKRDRCKWRYTANGCYSTKCGYIRAKDRLKEMAGVNSPQSNSSSNKERFKIWNQLWSLNIKHKIKHFLWKCLHCILPTNEENFRRTGKGDPLCKCCREEQETVEHILLHCKSREQAWATFPISWDGIKEYNWNFWKWWEQMQEASSRSEGTKHIEIAANFLWQLWKARNEWCFNLAQKEGHRISSKAVEEWLEFSEIGAEDKRTRRDEGQQDSNQSMVVGLMEQHNSIMYTDAGMAQGKAKAGLGIIAKANNGKIHATWAIPHTGAKDAAELEAIAIRTALGKALEENMTPLLILSDCKAVVDRISSGCQGLNSLDILIDDIRQLNHSFWKCSFCHIRRKMNCGSHRLAKLAIDLIQEIRWKAILNPQ